MRCVISNHTLTLSDEGVVYSFGRNCHGQLGLGNYDSPLLPIPIPSLPKIKQISCGGYFTVCVDFEGFVWSFGNNKYGQLGTGDTTDINIPKIIQDIPPVLSVACGLYHTLFITEDLNLWSCGNNTDGQLFLENLPVQKQLKPLQTSFSNITKISIGGYHSLFQNKDGDIYSCGSNKNGECGLGHFNSPQITPTKIPNLPPNIIQFVCGFGHNLFLDSEGNVFSSGYNLYGQLGLSHEKNQNVLDQIPDIPPIQTISCVFHSSFLLDFEGNVWSFGYNLHGELGHGDDSKNKLNPTKMQYLKKIQQISYGPIAFFGSSFLAKDFQDKIFAVGYNANGQLGIGNNTTISIPQELDPQYSTIWGGCPISRAKSARK